MCSLTNRTPEQVWAASVLETISLPRNEPSGYLRGGIWPLLYVARPGDGPASTDAARHTLQLSALYRGSWSTAPPVGARETWFEEWEGDYQDYVCRGRAKRLLGRAWIFPLRRNLTPFTRLRRGEAYVV